jgi:hypothetical protein
MAPAVVVSVSRSTHERTGQRHQYVGSKNLIHVVGAINFDVG